MNTRRLTPFLATLCLIFAPTASFGASQSSEPSEERREQAIQQVEDIKARLNLTDEQKRQVEPILRESVGKRNAILEKHGLGDALESGDRGGGRSKLRLRTARKLRSEINEVGEETSEELARVLNPSQMKEYEAIQEEMRAKLRERMGR